MEMTPAAAAKELFDLLEVLLRQTGRRPSPELTEFLSELSTSAGLKKPVRRRAGPSTRAPRVAGTGERAGADMSKTIEELANKLRAAFQSDEQFEALLRQPQMQKLSKPNVVTLYNVVFESPRPLAKSLTKPDVFNAIRRERINYVRGRS